MARFETGILAIDLGTTNSLVSYYDEIGKRGECIVDREGTNLLPSAVYFETLSDVIVGKTAKECAIVYPDRTALRFKRLMGEKKVAMTVDGKEISPQELSAYVLKRIVQNAYEALEVETKKAIITVPANFSEPARKATEQAGSIAGLEVVDILDEPVAAVYHCDSISNLVGKTVGVFDWGGGTLDIAVVSIDRDTIEEKIISGDTHLGGMDIDEAIVSYLKERYLDGVKLFPEDEQSLLKDVEEAKIRLSARDKARITLSSEKGRQMVILTRKEFEKQTEPVFFLVEKNLLEVKKNMSEAGIEKLDKIILVGGSTRLPQFRDLVEKLFPGIEIFAKDEDEAVAKGAAVYAKLVAGGGRRPKVFKNLYVPKKLTRVCARSYGIGIYSRKDKKDYILRIVKKGTVLPVEVEKIVCTNHDNQKEALLKIYEYPTTEAQIPQDDKYLIAKNTLKINGDLPKDSNIETTMTIKEDGTLHLFAKEPVGKTEITITASSKTLLSDEEITKTQKSVGETTVTDY